MRFAPRTIFGQLITGSVIVQTLVFGIFLQVSLRRNARDAQARDRQRLARQAGTISGVLGEPLATNNADMLDHMLRAMPVSMTIAGIRVTDPSGGTMRLVGQGLPPELSNREKQLLPEVRQHPWYHLNTDARGLDEGVQAVAVDGLVRGIVWITPNISVSRQYSRLDLENLATYAGCALLGNLLLVWGLTASMARPLRQLRNAAQQVEKNPNDLSAFPLPADMPNEAGELQACFNAMVNEIALQRRGTQETLNLLDSMLESAPVGFAFFDRDLRFVRLNDNLARMNGLPMAAHLGKRFREVFPRDVPVDLAVDAERKIAEVFRSRETMPEHEVSGVTPGIKELRTWQRTLFPVFTAQGDVRWVGTIITDISERKRSEEAMRRSERMASAGRLAASIAHEMNNPLESVTNLLYLLQSNSSLNTEAQEYISLAQSELTRVAEIAQQTLKFYKRSAQPVDVRLPELLRSVLVLHQARMQSPPIKGDLKLADNAIMFGYPGELRQVFANLLGNAIDAMPFGGTLYIRARSARRLGRHGMRVTVADTGLGMTEAVRLRMFEPFFTTKEATGTGLGLWVSSEILAKHRATLLVRSRPATHFNAKSGTVFSIFFPSDGVPRGPVRITSAAQALADHIV